MTHVHSMPRYASSFACSGPTCPETCCSGWNIHVDTPTRDSWRTLSLSESGPPLVRWTRDVESSEQNFAKNPAVIVRRPDGTCPMLTAEKLCSVHALHGHQALPRVCHTYPRGLVKSGHEVSLFMSLGCPEAARLALADPQALDMVPVDRQPIGRLPSVVQYDSPGLATAEELAAPDVDAVQAAATVFLNAARQLIRDPRLNVEQAWGLYWQKAIETWLVLKAGRGPAALDKLDELRHLSRLGDDLLPMARIAQSAFVARALPMPKRLRDALSYARDLVSRIERRFDTAERQAVRQALALSRALAPYGLGAPFTNADMDAACALYEEGYSRWFEPFDSAHPHFMKNHLLNRLGLRNFPVSGSRRFGEELSHEAMDLDVLRVFLVGQALLKQDQFGAQDYVLLVQTFTRNCTPGMDAATDAIKATATSCSD